MSSIKAKPTTRTFSEFSKQADYSLLDSLQADPQATEDGDDHLTREVFSGHYVPVTPTAIPEPEYISHSTSLFKELGLSQELALDELFRRLFSGDISVAQAPMRHVGWATGYALSICKALLMGRDASPSRVLVAGRTVYWGGGDAAGKRSASDGYSGWDARAPQREGPAPLL